MTVTEHNKIVLAAFNYGFDFFTFILSVQHHDK